MTMAGAMAQIVCRSYLSLTVVVDVYPVTLLGKAMILDDTREVSVRVGCNSRTYF